MVEYIKIYANERMFKVLKYYCENCKIEVETSECPVCGSRTINKNEVFWCDECNVPVIGNNHHHNLRYISSDIRPVFPEERLLIELLLNEPLKFKNCSCWSSSGGTYIIDGKKIRIKIKELGSINDQKFREKYFTYLKMNMDTSFDVYIRKFIEINEERYNVLSSDALEYISKDTNRYEFNSTFISFSGGKDSTVVSDLVMRALGTPKVMHIFGDTTLEFPETYEYVKRFKSNHKLTPMLNAKNREKDFFDMCEIVGPPSRVMRWCCTVFKTGAITNYVKLMSKNQSRIFTFYGIRRSESNSRSKYDKESNSPKITKQITISPIIDWLDGDVWLYILSRGIDFNYAYRLGFTRVGCWCCPNNSGWSEFLSKIFHPEDFYKFRNLLIKKSHQ